MTAFAQIIKNALNQPELSHIYVLASERMFRAAGKAPITFSALGSAGEFRPTPAYLGREGLLRGSQVPSSTTPLYYAEWLIKQRRRSESIEHAFRTAEGIQIPALNLLYPNWTTERPKQLLAILNKCLSAHSSGIAPAVDATLPFFHQLKSLSPLRGLAILWSPSICQRTTPNPR
jgi:hypothetical protein